MIPFRGTRLLLVEPTLHFIYTARSRYNIRARAQILEHEGWTIQVLPNIDARFRSSVYSSVAVQVIRTESTPLPCHIIGAENPNLRVNLSRCVTIYPEGFCSIRFSITLAKSWLPKNLNSFINDCLAGSISIRSVSSKNLSVEEVARETLREALASSSLTPVRESDQLIESFTVIQPRSLSPSISREPSRLPQRLASDLYEAAIRRVDTFDDIDISIAHRHQKNLSVYKGDYVLLNYHNLFLFVPSGKGHLPPDFYLEMTELRKVEVAFLYSLHAEATNRLIRLQDIPSSMRRLKTEVEFIERRRVEMLQVLSGLKILGSIAATRAKWFNEAAGKTFGISALEQILNDENHVFGDVIINRYTLVLQRTLQMATVIITGLSLIVAAIGVGAAVGLFETTQTYQFPDSLDTEQSTNTSQSGEPSP